MGLKRVGEAINDKSMKSMRFSCRKSINDINDKSMKGKQSPKVAYTEHVADELVRIFEAPKSRQFFLKCAWNLSEDTIWSAVEDTRKKGVKNPIGLFIFLCNNELRRSPVVG